MYCQGFQSLACFDTALSAARVLADIRIVSVEMEDTSFPCPWASEGQTEVCFCRIGGLVEDTSAVKEQESELAEGRSKFHDRIEKRFASPRSEISGAAPMIRYCGWTLFPTAHFPANMNNE